MRDKPFALQDVALPGTLNLSNGTLETINVLRAGESLPPMEWAEGEQDQSSARDYHGEWAQQGKTIEDDAYQQLMRLSLETQIKLSNSFKTFDGEPELIFETLTGMKQMIPNFPRLNESQTQLQLHSDYRMDDADFGMTRGSQIFLNGFAYRNKDMLAKAYAKYAEDGWFVKGTDYRCIPFHELGHVVANIYKISPMKVAEKVLGTNNSKEVIAYVKANLSEYAATGKNGQEIISEVFSAIYGNVNNEFALKYFQECLRIISEER